MGGAAVLLSFLVVIAIAGLAVQQLSELLLGNSPIIGTIILGSIEIFIIGFLDDLARLAPKSKLIGEFLIAGLVVWGANLSITSVQFLGLVTSKAYKAGIGMRRVEEAMIDSIRNMAKSV